MGAHDGERECILIDGDRCESLTINPKYSGFLLLLHFSLDRTIFNKNPDGLSAVPGKPLMYILRLLPFITQLGSLI